MAFLASLPAAVPHTLLGGNKVMQKIETFLDLISIVRNQCTFIDTSQV